MKDFRILNNEALEKVIGGVGGCNPITAAVETAIQEIKSEMDLINSESAGEGVIIPRRNEMLRTYGDMLSKFSYIQAIINPTIDDVEQTFTPDFITSLNHRPEEIFNEFKSAIHWL